MKETYCTLCEEAEPSPYQDHQFLRCPHCELVAKPRAVWLLPEEEKARYATHENTRENPGYEKFLTPVVNAVKKQVPVGSKGLDYGCGPGPVLAQLLEEAKMQVAVYDPYFFPNAQLENQTFDFITCTEVVEHFFFPGKEFAKLFSLLTPKGTLFLMTETYPATGNLKDWYYTKDPTHVVFFNTRALEWVAKKYGKTLTQLSNRLCYFH